MDTKKTLYIYTKNFGVLIATPYEVRNYHNVVTTSGVIIRKEDFIAVTDNVVAIKDIMREFGQDVYGYNPFAEVPNNYQTVKEDE